MSRSYIDSIHRYLDGELPAAERQAFEVELRRDPVLREATDAAREQSQLLRRAAPATSPAPHGFRDAVMAWVRQQPSRDDLVRLTGEEASTVDTVRLARRILVAAVLVFGLALLFGMRFLGTPDPESLQASEQLRSLDAKVKAMKAAELRAGERR